MARSKKGPALLEIIHREQQRGEGSPLDVPAWWARSGEREMPTPQRVDKIPDEQPPTETTRPPQPTPHHAETPPE
ncbi:unnamed protein product, partial [marine sediment metagenome]